jgi:hypothetical protein
MLSGGRAKASNTAVVRKERNLLDAVANLDLVAVIARTVKKS